MSESSTLSPARVAPVGAQEMAEHERLVRWVVRRQWLGGLPFHDALHEGRIGLWSALRHYDPQRGTAFSTYAVPAITRAIWRAVAARAQRGFPTHVRPTPSPSADPLQLVYHAQVEAALLDLVSTLPARLRGVIVSHYGLGDQPPQTFAAIGQSMGVSKQRVQQLHLRAILWLAHPAHSLPLRRLLDRHARTDYQQALAQQRQFARQRHRPSSAHRRQSTSGRVICSS